MLLGAGFVLFLSAPGAHAQESAQVPEYAVAPKVVVTEISSVAQAPQLPGRTVTAQRPKTPSPRGAEVSGSQGPSEIIPDAPF